MSARLHREGFFRAPEGVGAGLQVPDRFGQAEGGGVRCVGDGDGEAEGEKVVLADAPHLDAAEQDEVAVLPFLGEGGGEPAGVALVRSCR